LDVFRKKEIKMIPLTDKCSVLFSNILHTIKDESSCENYCRAECLARKMHFYKSEFALSQESCNTCNCYCNKMDDLEEVYAENMKKRKRFF